jgi:BolA protein
VPEIVTADRGAEYMNMQELIEARLTAAFAPEALAVIDESHKHHGHSGWREGGETHYRVQIRSAAFTGQSRVARHRAVNDALADAFARGLHALAIETRAPGE